MEGDPIRKYIDDKTEQAQNKMGDSPEERKANAINAMEESILPFAELDFSQPGSFKDEFSKEVDGRIYTTKLDFDWDLECNLFKRLSVEEAKSYGIDLERVRHLARFHIESDRFIFDSIIHHWHPMGVYFFDVSGLSRKAKDPYTHVGFEAPLSGITMGLPPNTPLGIATLFHELGHFWKYDADKTNNERFGDTGRAYGLLHKKEKLDTEAQAKIIREERSAWSISLQEVEEFLKPFVSPKTLSHIVHTSLAIYTQQLKQRNG